MIYGVSRKDPERIRSRPKRVLNPELMDRGIAPAYGPKHTGFSATTAERWSDTFRNEDFLRTVWKEFRQETNHWPWFAIAWHYVAQLLLLLCIAGSLTAAVKSAWLITVWLLPLGVATYLIMSTKEGAILVAEWKRYRRTNAAQ